MVNEQKIKTYSTKVDPQQPLAISFEGSGFEDVINDEGVIPTTINEKVIIQRIAKDLYKNATSGIRELYMNAVRGCEDGVTLFNYKEPHVIVTLNEGERIITIEDNGRGITKDRFKQVLRELGTSDNFSGKTTGQFGMGFASYMTLASVVVLDTIGDNGDNYKMICRDGTSSTYGGKSDLEGHGVKLTLTCYPEVDFDDICDKLYDTARHTSVPTTVVIQEFEMSPDKFDDGVNEIEQVRFDEDMDDEITDGQIRIETDDFTLLATDTISYNEGHVYLLNVPIDSEIDVPFDYWVLNIKDERKFQPMPDRDRMREESDNALQALITAALKEYFSDLSITNYTEYINSTRRQEYLWLISHDDYAPVGLKLTLSALRNASHLRQVTYEKLAKPDAHGLLYWLKSAGEHGIIYQGYKNKDYTTKAKEYVNEKCTFLIAEKSKYTEWRASVEVLEEFGVPTVKQLLKDNKVIMPKRENDTDANKIIIGHTHKRCYETIEFALDDITEECVRVDSMNMVKLMKFVRYLPTDMTFMRNDPALKDTDCQVFSEWIQEFKDVDVLTNKGLIKADELAQGPIVSYCSDIEPELRVVVEDAEPTVITDKTKVLGVVLLKYLEYNTSKTELVSNLIDAIDLDSVFYEKYGVRMYNDDTKKFFCSKLEEINEDYHELFARVLVNINNNHADKIADVEMEKYFQIVKEYNALTDDNEIEKLKFYHAKWMNLPNKTAGITKIFEGLITKAQTQILYNSFLMSRFLQQEALPKLFGDVSVKKVIYNDESRYTKEFQVEFSTPMRTLNFKNDLKVYGMELDLSNLSMRIFNKHSVINVKLVISS